MIALAECNSIIQRHPGFFIGEFTLRAYVQDPTTLRKISSTLMGWLNNPDLFSEIENHAIESAIKEETSQMITLFHKVEKQLQEIQASEEFKDWQKEKERFEAEIAELQARVDELEELVPEIEYDDGWSEVEL